MWRRNARWSDEAVGCRRSGLFLTFSVKIRDAVSGEWARERREWAGCEIVVVVGVRGEDVMAVT